ncbi:class I SAM-dependent methyltransferase [Halobaculum sp. MBLA0143]|uniref:class I SAM-dependent methyltransferase n=1 Tax=Halobaculum sp. MBLA0143 TaxID=3079933 RepID=UPI003523B32A
MAGFDGDEQTGQSGGDATGRRRAVAETYDRIADHFAETRHHPWPEVREFLADREGTVGLDLGAGNGRHAELLAERTDRVVALDASRALLAVARERATEREYDDRLAAVAGDAVRLPVRTDSVELGVYVATLHHVPTRTDRVASLSELARVLAPDGVAVVSVWSTAHDRFDREEGFDTTVDWTLPGGETVPRYYHVYDPAEFRADLADSRLTVRSTRVSSGNCYAVVTTSREEDTCSRPA